MANFAFILTNSKQLLLLILAGAALAAKAWLQSAYSSDEVFSAVALSELPAFQVLSFYPLPNNHVFFNLLNGAFAFTTQDPVITGRLLAAICYLGVLFLTYLFFAKRLSNPWRSLLFTLLIAVQFPIWGWSAQARGYELMLFFSLVSFQCAQRFLKEKTAQADILFPTAIAFGMFTQPAFLFWWVGLFIGGALVLSSRKESLRSWIMSHTIAGILTLVFYLPLLSFSGFEAITNNTYVQPEVASTGDFLNLLDNQNYLPGLFKEWVPVPFPHWFGVLLLSLSFYFLYRSGKAQRDLALLSLGIFAGIAMLVVFMLRAPFYRVLIAQSWLFWVVVLSAVSTLLKSKWQLAVSAVLIFYLAFSAYTNRRLIPHHLYYHDVNAVFQKLDHCSLPVFQDKTIGLSDESFYWWSLLKKNGCDLHFGTANLKGQEVVIINETENLEPENWGYKELTSCVGFVFYEKY